MDRLKNCYSRIGSVYLSWLWLLVKINSPGRSYSSETDNPNDLRDKIMREDQQDHWKILLDF